MPKTIEKGILKFNLDEPEGRIAHLRASKSKELLWALSEIQEEIRKRQKNLDFIKDEAVRAIKEETYYEISKVVYDAIESNNINIEELQY